MRRIGLTGGIASGKSMVSAELARLGAVVIDADLLAREAVAPGTAGLAAVLARFGPGVRRPDGTLDRARLAEIVFFDDDARADLEAIVHPIVRARAAELEADAPLHSMVVHVIPLLVETGQQQDFDGIVVVDAPVETQVSRLMHRNDLTTAEARARLRAQASRPARREVATWIIDNSGSEAETLTQVRALWDGPLAALRAPEPPPGQTS